MLMNLFKFKGGVKPPTHKAESTGRPIAVAPLPSRLVVPLHQSIGGTPRPVVSAGDTVLKGQLIGEADGWISAAVHAPTSGTVLEVAMHVQPHPSGLDALCVVIEPDGRDEWIARAPLDYRSLTPEEVREHLRQAGVVGLGGAVFPTHGKLTPAKTVPMDELVINGAECEPFITCDDLLMRERAEEVVRGIAIFRDLLQPKKVLIGIEDNKPEAAAAMRAAVDALNEPFSVVQVPTLYPAGGAKQLIRVLTGKEVPASKRSTDLGVQCFNVATAYTAWRAIAHGEPVVSRLVTLTGNVHEPRNYEVLIGTPMDELLKLAHPHPDTDGIVMGGPMMGFLVPDMHVPVVKATNCLIAHDDRLFPPKPPEMPCIRCGACAAGLPARTATVRDVLVRAREEFRQDAGVPHLRLHRMWLLLLRLPVTHPAGPVFPLRQERDLGARAREERCRRRQGALRVQAGARRTREGGKGREAGQGGRRAGGQEGGRGGCHSRRSRPCRRRRAGCGQPRERGQKGRDRGRHGARQGAARSGAAEEYRSGHF